jgi:hypothetical protein
MWIWTFLVQGVAHGKIFPLYIWTCKNGFPYCGPIWPSGIMYWTNLNLYYVRKLSGKSESFRPSSSWKEDFQPPSLFLHLNLIISINFNFLCLRTICTKFHRINWMVLEKISGYFFQWKQMQKWFSWLWPYPIHGDYELKHYAKPTCKSEL